MKKVLISMMMAAASLGMMAQADGVRLCQCGGCPVFHAGFYAGREDCGF